MNGFSEKIFADPNYRHYVGEYYGDLTLDKEVNSNYIITEINNKYLIVSTKKNISLEALKKLITGVITYIERVNLYSLEVIDPIDAAKITDVQNIDSLDLTGEGVLIGMLDTGINYLNREFIDENGNTRVELIWDQTLLNDEKITKKDIDVPFGTIYTREEINSAITAYNNGGNPYDIVKSKDEIGHGTKMACVIGGRGILPEIKGAAPKCNYVCVKLVETYDFKEDLEVEVPLYSLAPIFAGIDFLVRYAIKFNRPMVIYLPIGSNFSNHKGDTLLEKYIDDISINRGIVVVTGAGNEGDMKSHTSGYVEKNSYRDINIYIDPLQKSLATQLWISRPNIMSINIISPSGEETGIIPAFINLAEEVRFIIENTNATIKYYLPEESSGDELIEIYFTNVQAGTWKIRLIAEYILDGRYDAWLPQRGIAFGDTQFTFSDPYGTLTSPGPSTYIINVANYDQTRNFIVNSSGKGFEDDVVDRIDIAAGGVNVVTTDIEGGGTSVVNGTSVSAAVVAGACALLMEWGIVKMNTRNMYSQKIKTFLIRGTQKRQGDIYPNPELGYGILDMIGVFRNMT